MVYVSSWPPGLERQRCIHPDQHRLFVGGIEPAVSDVALEPEAVAFLKDVEFQLVQPEFQAALQHVNEFFANMRVRAIASGFRWRRFRVKAQL